MTPPLKTTINFLKNIKVIVKKLKLENTKDEKITDSNRFITGEI